MPLSGPRPQPGDLIEFKCFGYEHWGVYVGDDHVVHLTAPEGVTSLTSSSNTSAEVRKERLNIAANGHKYKVNNKNDVRKKPKPPEKIVQTALKRVGQKRRYNLTNANCEHFATELRYGRKYCDQVANAEKVTGVKRIILCALSYIFNRLGLGRFNQ